MVSIDDFKKLEIRIGTIESAEKVVDLDKLVKMTIDLGSEQRQIMAGIAQFYPEPSILVGKQAPFLVNLEPRVFKGYESQGMMLAADSDGKPILLTPEEKVPNGSIIK